MAAFDEKSNGQASPSLSTVARPSWPLFAKEGRRSLRHLLALAEAVGFHNGLVIRRGRRENKFRTSNISHLPAPTGIKKKEGGKKRGQEKTKTTSV